LTVFLGVVDILKLEDGHLFGIENFDLFDFAKCLFDVFLQAFEQLFFLEFRLAV
jgi:hypothetical protein